MIKVASPSISSFEIVEGNWMAEAKIDKNA